MADVGRGDPDDADGWYRHHARPDNRRRGRRLPAECPGNIKLSRDHHHGRYLHALRSGLPPRDRRGDRGAGRQMAEAMMDGGILILDTRVAPDWVDYNGHMGDFAYGIVFSNAATAYMERLGLHAAYREETGATLYTLDSRIGFLRECHLGETLRVVLQVLDVDAKRMHLLMRLYNSDGVELALCEQVLMHVSRSNGVVAAAPLPQSATTLLSEDRQRHETGERPAWLDRRIGLKR